MNNQLIGDGFDSYQSVWNIWWVKYSVFSLENPFFTNHIFYPIGTDLFAHTLSPLACAFLIPFQLVFGLIFSYNFLIILSFVLSGYGGYRLALYITSDKTASLFSGLVFGFNTYHFARAMGHLNLVSIQWIPFYVLFLLKMRKNFSLKNVFFTSFFLILNAFWADYHYVIFLVFFTFMLLFYDLTFQKGDFKKILFRYFIMIFVSIGTIFLVLSPLFLGILSGDYAYVSTSASEQIFYSADLIGFFVPNNLNLFFGEQTKGIISHFSNSGVEAFVYIGYSVLLLVTYGIVKTWDKIKFWFLGAFGFLILSLGPFLNIFGINSFTFYQFNIPLPGCFLFSVLPIPRAPSRFIIMAILCLSVISAIALKTIRPRFLNFKYGKKLWIVFSILLFGTFLMEVNISPFPVVDTSVPTFYSDLAEVKGNFSVLDIPQNYFTNNKYMYYGTVSEKPLVVGSISRVSPRNIIFLDAFPIIGQMNTVENGGTINDWSDILIQDVDNTNLNAFHYYNVKYIILHKDMTWFSDDVKHYLTELLDEPVFIDDKIIVFNTNATQLVGTFMFLSSGWTSLNELNGEAIRYMDGDGVVNVISSSDQFCTLRFSARTVINNKNLTVFLNGNKIANFQIKVNNVSTLSIDNFHLKKGVNKILLHSDQIFVPADVYPGSSDTRRFSIAFQNIHLQPKIKE